MGSVEGGNGNGWMRHICDYGYHSNAHTISAPSLSIPSPNTGDWHVDPRNEAVHGKGWTEWELVLNAKPRFPGAYQPNLPINSTGWGPYYPENVPSNMEVSLVSCVSSLVSRLSSLFSLSPSRYSRYSLLILSILSLDTLDTLS